MKTIASYDYDDIGRVKTKHLDPGYSNLTTGLSELESLNYNFNLHSQIIGINKDYAIKRIPQIITTNGVTILAFILDLTTMITRSPRRNWTGRLRD